MAIRLVRFLAQCGVASRRKSADLIREGRVMVNGERAESFSREIDESQDQVKVDGRVVQAPREHLYVLLNKPAGVVCSHADPHNPETIYDLLPEKWRKRLRFVGRLDKATTGLLLLTDDGRLANQLAHPSYEVDKRYLAQVAGRVSDETVAQLEKGVQLEDGPTWPAKVRVRRQSREETVLDLVIHEGRNRIVRRMCEAVGHPVRKLERTGYGPLELKGLRRTEWRELSQAEVKALKRETEKQSG